MLFSIINALTSGLNAMTCSHNAMRQSHSDSEYYEGYVYRRDDREDYMKYSNIPPQWSGETYPSILDNMGVPVRAVFQCCNNSYRVFCVLFLFCSVLRFREHIQAGL